MKNILKLGDNCCGCGGCQDVCPKNSITFKENSEGFLYPQVDSSCVDCGLCLKHCPVEKQVEKPPKQLVFAARNKDRETLEKSSSGGVFAPLANIVLDKGGVVFGCSFDENLKVKHIAVENKADLVKLQGSKYVQSNTIGVFPKVKEILETGRQVLFSGTGCQVAGLKAFLGKSYDNLFTVDVVCHGVPSPKLFEKYLCYLQQKDKAEVTYYNFRSKEKHSWGHCFKYISKKAHNDSGYFDPYYYAFLKAKNYRESCYSCKFSNENRVSDITLADFWSVKVHHPELYSKNGNSAVIVNTEKGEKYWNEISKNFDFVQSDYKKAADGNRNLTAPASRPESRNTFYEGLSGDLSKYFGKKLKPPFQLKKSIKRFVKKIIGC